MLRPSSCDADRGGRRGENFAPLVQKRGSAIARRRRRYIRPSRNKLPVFRINGKITADEVRLIDSSGTNHGTTPVSEALAIADSANLDLVEVSPNASPPVCRVLDYGKFLYEHSKKEKEARRSQKQVEFKEIRLRPKTTEHHRSFKVRDARRWLEDGMKVRVRIRFRGREITLPDVAREDMDEIYTELSDVAHVEASPSMEGRTMLMVLAPGAEKGV